MSMSSGEVVLLQVVDVKRGQGCILGQGSEEQYMLPAAELAHNEEQWPQIGDKVYVVIEKYNASCGDDQRGNVNNDNRKTQVFLASEAHLDPLTFAAPTAWHNTWLTSIVYNTIEQGSFVICDGGTVGFGVIGFIHHTEKTRELRIGEQLDVRITYIRDDGRVNCSMRQPKELSREADAAQILAHLRTCRDGAMPYSDQTPPDIVREKFAMSKAAFKRALGKLMADQLIEQDENWTRLINDNSQHE